MDYFMPSEVARLILGYLVDKKLQRTFRTFLTECQDLSEYWQILRSGKIPCTTIMGQSLMDILNEFALLKLGAVCSSPARSRLVVANCKETSSDVRTRPTKEDVLACMEEQCKARQQADKMNENKRLHRLKKKKGHPEAASRQTQVQAVDKLSAHQISTGADNGHSALQDTKHLQETAQPASSHSGEVLQLICGQPEEMPCVKDGNIEVENTVELDLHCRKSNTDSLDFLDRILGDTNFHERLAENINKARVPSNSDSSKRNSKEKVTLVPAGQKGKTNGVEAVRTQGSLTTEAIDINQVIEMTEQDPTFHSFLQLFQHAAAIPISQGDIPVLDLPSEPVRSPSDTTIPSAELKDSCMELQRCEPFLNQASTDVQSSVLASTEIIMGNGAGVETFLTSNEVSHSNEKFKTLNESCAVFIEPCDIADELAKTDHPLVPNSMPNDSETQPQLNIQHGQMREGEAVAGIEDALEKLNDESSAPGIPNKSPQTYVMDRDRPLSLKSISGEAQLSREQDSVLPPTINSSPLTVQSSTSSTLHPFMVGNNLPKHLIAPDENSLTVFSFIQKKSAEMVGEVYVHHSQRGEGMCQTSDSTPTAQLEVGKEASERSHIQRNCVSSDIVTCVHADQSQLLLPHNKINVLERENISVKDKRIGDVKGEQTDINSSHIDDVDGEKSDNIKHVESEATDKIDSCNRENLENPLTCIKVNEDSRMTLPERGPSEQMLDINKHLELDDKERISDYSKGEPGVDAIKDCRFPEASPGVGIREVVTPILKKGEIQMNSNQNTSPTSSFDGFSYPDAVLLKPLFSLHEVQAPHLGKKVDATCLSYIATEQRDLNQHKKRCKGLKNLRKVVPEQSFFKTEDDIDGNYQNPDFSGLSVNTTSESAVSVGKSVPSGQWDTHFSNSEESILDSKVRESSEIVISSNEQSAGGVDDSNSFICVDDSDVGDGEETLGKEEHFIGSECPDTSTRTNVNLEKLRSDVDLETKHTSCCHPFVSNSLNPTMTTPVKPGTKDRSIILKLHTPNLSGLQGQKEFKSKLTTALNKLAPLKARDLTLNHFGQCHTLSSPPYSANNFTDSNSPQYLRNSVNAMPSSCSLPARPTFQDSADLMSPSLKSTARNSLSAFKPLQSKQPLLTHAMFSPDAHHLSASSDKLTRTIITVDSDHAPFIPEHCKKIPTRRIRPLEVSSSTPSPLQDFPGSPMNCVADVLLSAPNSPAVLTKDGSLRNTSAGSSLISPVCKMIPPKSLPVSTDQQGKDLHPSTNQPSDNGKKQKSLSECPVLCKSINTSFQLPPSPSKRKPRRIKPIQLSSIVKSVTSGPVMLTSSSKQYESSPILASRTSDVMTESQSEAEAFRMLKSFINSSYSKPQPRQKISSTNQCFGQFFRETCKHRKWKGTGKISSPKKIVSSQKLTSGKEKECDVHCAHKRTEDSESCVSVCLNSGQTVQKEFVLPESKPGDKPGPDYEKGSIVNTASCLWNADNHLMDAENISFTNTYQGGGKTPSSSCSFGNPRPFGTVEFCSNKKLDCSRNVDNENQLVQNSLKINSKRQESFTEPIQIWSGETFCSTATQKNIAGKNCPSLIENLSVTQNTTRNSSPVTGEARQISVFNTTSCQVLETNQRFVKSQKTAHPCASLAPAVKSSASSEYVGIKEAHHQSTRDGNLIQSAPHYSASTTMSCTLAPESFTGMTSSGPSLSGILTLADGLESRFKVTASPDCSQFKSCTAVEEQQNSKHPDNQESLGMKTGSWAPGSPSGTSILRQALIDSGITLDGSNLILTNEEVPKSVAVTSSIQSTPQMPHSSKSKRMATSGKIPKRRGKPKSQHASSHSKYLPNLLPQLSTAVPTAEEERLQQLSLAFNFAKILPKPPVSNTPNKQEPTPAPSRHIQIVPTGTGYAITLPPDFQDTFQKLLSETELPAVAAVQQHSTEAVNTSSQTLLTPSTTAISCGPQNTSLNINGQQPPLQRPDASCKGHYGSDKTTLTSVTLNKKQTTRNTDKFGAMEAINQRKQSGQNSHVKSKTSTSGKKGHMTSNSNVCAKRKKSRTKPALQGSDVVSNNSQLAGQNAKLDALCQESVSDSTFCRTVTKMADRKRLSFTHLRQTGQCESKGQKSKRDSKGRFISTKTNPGSCEQLGRLSKLEKSTYESSTAGKANLYSNSAECNSNSQFKRSSTGNKLDVASLESQTGECCSIDTKKKASFNTVEEEKNRSSANSSLIQPGGSKSCLQFSTELSTEPSSTDPSGSTSKLCLPSPSKPGVSKAHLLGDMAPPDSKIGKVEKTGSRKKAVRTPLWDLLAEQVKTEGKPLKCKSRTKSEDTGYSSNVLENPVSLRMLSPQKSVPSEKGDSLATGCSDFKVPNRKRRKRSQDDHKIKSEKKSISLKREHQPPHGNSEDKVSDSKKRKLSQSSDKIRKLGLSEMVASLNKDDSEMQAVVTCRQNVKMVGGEVINHRDHHRTSPSHSSTKVSDADSRVALHSFTDLQSTAHKGRIRSGTEFRIPSEDIRPKCQIESWETVERAHLANPRSPLTILPDSHKQETSLPFEYIGSLSLQKVQNLFVSNKTASAAPVETGIESVSHQSLTGNSESQSQSDIGLQSSQIYQNLSSSTKKNKDKLMSGRSQDFLSETSKDSTTVVRTSAKQSQGTDSEFSAFCNQNQLPRPVSDPVCHSDETETAVALLELSMREEIKESQQQCRDLERSLSPVARHCQTLNEEEEEASASQPSSTCYSRAVSEIIVHGKPGSLSLANRAPIYNSSFTGTSSPLKSQLPLKKRLSCDYLVGDPPDLKESFNVLLGGDYSIFESPSSVPPVQSFSQKAAFTTQVNDHTSTSPALHYTSSSSPAAVHRVYSLPTPNHTADSTTQMNDHTSTFPTLQLMSSPTPAVHTAKTYSCTEVATDASHISHATSACVPKDPSLIDKPQSPVSVAATFLCEEGQSFDRAKERSSSIHKRISASPSTPFGLGNFSAPKREFGFPCDQTSALPVDPFVSAPGVLQDRSVRPVKGSSCKSKIEKLLKKMYKK